ncbi:chemotaxis protein CheA [Geotalea sp. SG265]|uniref:chemotaxis protein CheA n=1 Tax=Geotalea sp. SG265 TaxID=2922867 RepID=UPI001FAF3564|nr:chemotaxis protein CheA [Geotalea sp. SG265]
MDMSHYRELFISEAREHLRVIAGHILALENCPEDRGTLDALFRVAHSIKGMAASMGYGEISELAHRLEDLMDRFRKGPLVFDSRAADLFLEGADLLQAMIDDVDRKVTGSRSIEDMIRRIVAFPGGHAPLPATGTASPASAVQNNAIPLETAPPQTIRVKTDLLDSLINITGELVTNKSRIFAVSSRLSHPGLDNACLELSRLLRGLQDQVMKARLVPFSQIGDGFSRAVRDVAKRTGKEIALEVTGSDVELDRGILEQVTDPLLHILRNAADHGIELPGERRAAGKPPKGSINLTVRREKDQVIIMVEDDGKGMDPARLVSSAVERGLITGKDADRISRHDALMLICLPGFSTAGEVTEVSGRGVGMDAVQSALHPLGGRLLIDTEQGKGSKFSLLVPAGIAIMHTLVMDCGPMQVAVPVAAIIQTRQLERELILKQGKMRVFVLEGETIPLLSLNRILRIPSGPATGGEISLLICEIRGKRVGLVVDRFLSQHELYIKPLGRPLAKLKGLLGTAILGDGEIIYVLDVPNLL